MVESTELGHKASKQDYASRKPDLRASLLEAQYKMVERKDFSCLLMASGMPGGGKGEAVNRLNEWMDLRLIRALSFLEPIHGMKWNRQRRFHFIP